ncbi:YecA family protein [Neobacillus sp. Marseille-QA0830]
MTFLEKIKPHLTSNDILIQQTVLYALHDYPNVPEAWTVALLKEAFQNKEKLESVLVYVDHQKITEEALNVLLENIPNMDKNLTHLAIDLLRSVEVELALKYKEQLNRYFTKDTWAFYELIAAGTKEIVLQEFAQTVDSLESAHEFQHKAFVKAKKLANSIVHNGWITGDEIDKVIQENLEEQWFSYEGILSVYMIGLMKLEKYIPMLASLLNRDEDVLLEEVADVLIQFQSDVVVKEVAPYLNQSESIIYASSVVENIKTDFAVEALREAYRSTEELDEQDMLIEALCHQFSKEALPEISAHMDKEYFTNLVDIEQVVYSYYSIIGEKHPDMEFWRQAALEQEMEFKEESEQGGLLHNFPVKNENKIGRNDPCPCGSGKKYKKCCGK